jgi:uncharacterized protein (TIGR03000 family)
VAKAATAVVMATWPLADRVAVAVEAAASAAPATLVVTLPADAKLTIDDASTTSTSSPRVFTSLDLPAGKDFYYTVRGDIIRNGQTITAQKRVRVRAGEETPVLLEFPTATVASK